MQHSNRVVVLRVGALHVVVIYLLNNHAENGIFTGLLCVEMAFVNTSIMFNRTARKVTTATRCFPSLGDATFGGSLPSELKLYWLWQRNWKKKKVAKPLVIPQRTYLAHSCSMYQIRNAQLSCVRGIISVNYLKLFPQQWRIQIFRWWGEGGGAIIQTPQISGGPRSQKQFFWSKNKGGRASRASPLAPPLLRIFFWLLIHDQ